MMKRYGGMLVIAGFILMITHAAVAQENTVSNPTLMVPAESISRIILEILPHEIDLGKYFPKDIRVQSIEDLKITKDKFLFRVVIYGENIEHTLKFGDQSVILNIGKVNLTYGCEASFRFDKDQGILFVTPKVRDITRADKIGQGNKILSPLLEAMSDIEYPIEIEKIEPFVTRLGKRTLNIEIDISKIYTDNNMLFIEVVPGVTEKAKP